MNINNIIFIGMMGSGKSTVGRLLSDRLGAPWVDLDEAIVHRTGKTIPQIFAEKGEMEFRRLESSVLQDVLLGKGQVVTTGGGAVLSAENRRLMQNRGWVVWLDAPIEVLAERVAGDDNRPLIQGDVLSKLRGIAEARSGLYDFADLKIDSSLHSMDMITDMVLEFIRKHS